ncbi:hypothetical protein DAETH_34070 (plasmid) [Deinococcus aetherius]|uniref:Uncharacterized protein n=1 Tax=Deinococcus aetherius TaxID=200252 RepID=A0ABN6RJD8_9DEIO|nr:hypothetical protein [Deinococcus aetherius]BDP43438.1 hypothetical protein DAETH_34070 [Deinococcus aetherius]
MPYKLTIEVRDQGGVEQFQREFGDVLEAKRYAHNHVRGDVFWTVREDHLDGLAPNYALRIEGVGEDFGKPLDLGDDEGQTAESDSLFTPQGPVDDSR